VLDNGLDDEYQEMPGGGSPERRVQRVSIMLENSNEELLQEQKSNHEGRKKHED